MYLYQLGGVEPPTGSKMIQLTCQVMIDGTGNKQLKDLPDPPAGQGDSKIFTGDTAFLHLLLGRSFHRSIQSLANSEDSKVAAFSVSKTLSACGVACVAGKADDGSKRIKLHCQSFGEARQRFLVALCFVYRP